MPEPLIVPGVVRYAINGTYAGQPVTNILDMDIDSTGTRADDVIDQAHIIVSAWADNIIELLTNQYQALNVSWVDMSSSSGTTGVTSDGTGSDFPQPGGLSAASMPGNVAFLIHKNVTAARGSRSGRMFLAGVPENVTVDANPSNILTVTRDDLNTKFASFKSAVEQDGGGVNYGSQCVVVHTHNTSPPAEPPHIVYVGQSEVTSFTADPIIGSMRRRLPPRS